MNQISKQQDPKFQYKTFRHFAVTRYRHAGFTLIEVLVAVLVLTIGMLGMAGLQAVGVKESQNTYFRTQAAMLANDMVDRMRANRAAATSSSLLSPYDYDGSIVSNPAVCDIASASCDENEMASYDLNQWREALDASGLPAANGTVQRIDGSASAYMINVYWDENRDGSTGLGCDPTDPGDMSCVRLVVQL